MILIAVFPRGGGYHPADGQATSGSGSILGSRCLWINRPITGEAVAPTIRARPRPAHPNPGTPCSWGDVRALYDLDAWLQVGFGLGLPGSTATLRGAGLVDSLRGYSSSPNLRRRAGPAWRLPCHLEWRAVEQHASLDGVRSLDRIEHKAHLLRGCHQRRDLLVRGAGRDLKERLDRVQVVGGGAGQDGAGQLIRLRSRSSGPSPGRSVVPRSHGRAA